MNSYHSRLRQLVATCEFADVDKEIKSQIIKSCTLQHLCRKALRDSTMTLEALLAEALEVSEQQATDIESPGSANAVFFRSPKHWTRKLVVLTVVKAGRTMPKLGVWLRIESAIPAKYMAIMHSIVEALRKVSLMGKADHLKEETGSKDVETSSPREPSTK